MDNKLLKNKLESLFNSLSLYEEVSNALFLESKEQGIDYALLSGKLYISIQGLKSFKSELLPLLDDKHIVIQYIRDIENCQEQLLTIITSLKGMLEGSSYDRAAYTKDIDKYKSMLLTNQDIATKVLGFYQTLSDDKHN